MNLSGTQIKALGIVSDDDPGSYRAASYDLRVAKVFHYTKGAFDDKFTLEPQGLVEVVSIERLEIPENVVAYAMVKTGLCNEGVLAVNVGIIDPGYKGPISSSLVNIGRTSHEIRKGDVFLRIVFQTIAPDPSFKVPAPISTENYKKLIETKVSRYFGESFLDIPNTVKLVSAEVVGRVIGDYKKALFLWVPLAGILFAILSFLVNYGATYSARNAALEVGTLKQDVLGINSSERERLLKERLEGLERRLQQVEREGKAAPLSDSAVKRGPAK